MKTSYNIACLVPLTSEYTIDNCQNHFILIRLLGFDHVYQCAYLTHTNAYAHTYMQTVMLRCMHLFIYTYIHSYIHTIIHTYIHTYIGTYIHTYIHTYNTYIHTHIAIILICVCDPEVLESLGMRGVF